MAKTITDALLAEVLGDAEKIRVRLEQIQASLPEFESKVSSAKNDIHNTFEDFKAATMALAQFTKQHHKEEREAAEASTRLQAASLKDSLLGFSKWFYLLAALGVTNAVLLSLVLAKLLFQ